MGGIAALVSLSPNRYGVEPTISMASMPSAMAMQPTTAWTMQPRRSVHFMQPARAQNNMESQFESSTVSQKQGRREMMNGLAGAFAGAVVPKAAFAVSPVDIKDDRKAVAKGYDIIYEARDLDIDQRIRDGMTQSRESTDFTKKRIAESVKRISTEILPNIEKQYWWEAGEQLRRQAGTLRFDLNTLADAKAGQEKKVALAARKTLLTDIEKLDLAIKRKDETVAVKQFGVVADSLNGMMKAL